jgi:hypothetical protein
MVFAMTSMARADLNFDFEPGDYQGWTFTNHTGWFMNGDGGTPPHNVESANAAGTGRSHDGGHPTFIFTSPAFYLDPADASDLTFELIGGQADEAFPAGYTLTQLLIDHPNSENNSGYAGAALRNVATGEYFFEQHRTGSGGNEQVMTISAAQLDTLDQGAQYVLDFIDWNQGSWGWTQIDEVHIPGSQNDGTLNSIISGDYDLATTWAGTVAGGVPTSLSIANILNGHTISIPLFSGGGAAGELNINAGGTVEVDDILDVSWAISIAATGALNINAGGTVNAAEASTTGITFADNSATLNAAKLTIDSAIDLDSADLNLNNDVTIAAAGTLSMGATPGAYTAATGSLTLEGTLTNATNISVVDLNVAAPLTVTTGNVLAVSGTLSVDDNGVLQVDDGFEVGGLGTIANFKLNGGTLQATSATTNSAWDFQGGTVDAGSTLNGDHNIVIGADRSSDGLFKMLGTNNATTPTIVVQRGAVQDIPAGHVINFASNNDSHGAAVEVTANSRFEIGTAAGQVNWVSGRGGFAASGANHTVTLVDALDVALATNWATWNNQNFQIGSETATHVVDFTNDIDFGGGNRTLSAFGTGGKLSGALTNVTRINKRGSGVLEIPNLTTAGQIWLYDGTLKVTGALHAGATNDQLIEFDGPNAVMDVAAGATVDANQVNVYDGGHLDVSGTLNTYGTETFVKANSSVTVRSTGYIKSGYNGGGNANRNISWDDPGCEVLIENGGHVEGWRIHLRNGVVADINGFMQARENIYIHGGNGGGSTINIGPGGVLSGNYYENQNQSDVLVQGAAGVGNEALLHIGDRGNNNMITRHTGTTITIGEFGELRVGNGNQGGQFGNKRYRVTENAHMVIKDGGHVQTGGFEVQSGALAEIQNGGTVSANFHYQNNNATLEIGTDLAGAISTYTLRDDNNSRINDGSNAKIIVGGKGVMHVGNDHVKGDKRWRTFDGTVQIDVGGVFIAGTFEGQRGSTTIVNGLLQTQWDVHQYQGNNVITGEGNIDSRDVYITATDRVAPGNSTGTLTAAVTGQFKMQNGSVLDIEIGSTTDHDLLVVNGALNLDSTWNVAISEAAGALGGIVPADQIDIITFTSVVDGLQTYAIDTSAIDSNLLWDASGATLGIDADSVFITGLTVDIVNPVDTYTWDNDVTPDAWNVGTEWSKGGFPDSGPPTITDKAIVAAGIAQVNSNQAIHTLEVTGTGAVDVQSNTLSVTNDIDLNAGSLTIGAAGIVDQVNILNATGGTLNVTGQVTAKQVTLATTTNLNSGAILNAQTVAITAGTTTVDNGVTVNGDFTVDGGTLAITGNVALDSIVYNSGSFNFGGVGNTLTVGTYRQNGGSSALAANDFLVAGDYELNGGSVGFAMTGAGSNVTTLASTTLAGGFTHTYTGVTENKGGTFVVDSAITATEALDLSAGTTNLNAAVTTTAVGERTIITAIDAIRHLGYHTGPNGVMDLNNNNSGGMMGGGDPTAGPTFFGESLLTSGPGNRGLDFDNDGDFINTGSIGQGDQYSNMWLAYVNVSAANAGNWTFRNAGDDDRGGIWLDLDQDGVFESSAAGLGSNRGEQLSWEDGGGKTVSLAEGKYLVAFTHAEGTGGSRADFRFNNPTLGGEQIVKPANPAQAGIWSVGGTGVSTNIGATATLNINATGALTTDGIKIDGTLNLNAGGTVSTGAVAVNGAANINGDGLGATSVVVNSGAVATLAHGDAVSNAGLIREVPLTAENGGIIKITNAGGLNQSSQMLIKTYGGLSGDISNLTFSDSQGSGLVTFQNDALLMPTAGAVPTPAQLGAVKLLYGVQTSGTNVAAGETVEAIGGTTVFRGAYFGAGIYGGGDYTGTLTGQVGSAENMAVVINGQEIKFNTGATFASDTGTTDVTVMQGGRMTVNGNAGGLGDINATGFYDPFDGSGMNTTGQSIFRVQGNDKLQNGQDIRIEKGLFNTYGTEWPVTGGATVTVTFGPLGGMAPLDWGNNQWACDHIRRGSYIFEAGSYMMLNNANRLSQSESRWGIDPGAYVAIRDNVALQNIDPRGLDGVRRELDNVNWIIGGADQLSQVHMGEGRRIAKFYNQNDRLHDNVDILPSVSAPPTFVIFSSTGGGFNSNGVGGDLNLDAEIKLPGVDIFINDGLQSSDHWITMPMNENDMTLRTLKTDGRVNIDGVTVQADDITVREGYLRFGSNERNMAPTLTGKIDVWDNSELEIYAGRDEGAGSTAATNAALMRYKVENDTLTPGGVNLSQGAMLLLFYRGLESASPIGGNQNEVQQGHTTATPHVVNQTINVLGTGDVVGQGRTWSGFAMTLLRFDEEAGDGNNDNHVIFPNIILNEGAHVGVQRSNVDREELRLGVTLKGNALMERENDEWSFEDVSVEVPGVDEYTLKLNRDGNGGQIDVYGTIGQGVTIMPEDTTLDFNWGADMEDGAFAANLGKLTPGAPGSGGFLRAFTGSDGNNPMTGGTWLIGGNEDAEVRVNDALLPDPQIVNNFGTTIKVLSDGTGTRDGLIRTQRGLNLDDANDVPGMVVYANIVLDADATAQVDRSNGTEYNMLRVDTGTGGGALNANWGGHTFNMEEITGAGRLYNGNFSVSSILAPGASAGTLTVANLTTETGLVYEMEFGLGAEDSIAVEGNLVINDGWTLKILSDGGFSDPAAEYDIYTWTGAGTVTLDGGDPTLLDATTYTIDTSAVGWGGVGVLNYDLAGKRIFLTGISAIDALEWDAGVVGTWSTGVNWSTDTVPAANSIAQIAQAGTATVASSGQIAYALSISSGTLDVNAAGADLSITTDLELDGTFFDVVVANVTEGTLNIGGDLNVAPTDTGTVNVEAAGLANATNANVGAGGILNVTGGTLAASNDVDNAGNVTITGTVNVGNDMNNSGTTTVVGGDLNVTNTLTTSGTLTANSGNVNATTLNSSGTTDLSGAGGTIGTVNVTGGTTTLASPTITDLNVTDGTLNTASTTVTNMTVNGATAIVNTTGAAAASDLQMVDGTVNLTGGNLSVATTKLTGGAINTQTNKLVVSNTATVNGNITIVKTSGADFDLVGTNVSVPAAMGDRAVMLNGGTVTITPPAVGEFTAAEVNNGNPIRHPVAPDVLWAESGGTHSLLGSGADVWGNNDNFTFVYQEFDAGDDIDISAHLNDGVSFTSNPAGNAGVHAWAKAGLMIRQSLTFNSRNVAEIIAANDGNGINAQARRTDGAGTAGSNATGPRINHGDDVYLRLTYTAATKTFQTYYSDDPSGAGWTLHSNPLLMDGGQDMTGTIYVGMAVTAHDVNRLTGATFSELEGFKTAAAGLSMPFTEINAVETSTAAIPLELVGPVELGGVTTAAGKTLTIDSPAADIQLTNLTLGGGSLTHSTQATGVGSTAVTIEVSGTATAGDGIATLGDYVNDFENTNLTLADGATFDWTFGAGADNYLDVGGDVVISDNVTIQLQDGGGSASGVDVQLMQAFGYTLSAVNVTVVAPAASSWTFGALEVDGDFLVLRNLSTGVVVAVPGDTDGDDDVDDEDLANFQAQFGLKGAGNTADFDDDGDVDLDDFATIRANFGTGVTPAPVAPDFSATPEPATMSLLAIGGLLVIRRRRRKA